LLLDEDSEESLLFGFLNPWPIMCESVPHILYALLKSLLLPANSLPCVVHVCEMFCIPKQFCSFLMSREVMNMQVEVVSLLAFYRNKYLPCQSTFVMAHISFLYFFVRVTILEVSIIFYLLILNASAELS